MLTRLKLADISIKSQLRVFAAVLLLLMTASGLYGLYRLQAADSFLQTMYRDRVVALNNLKAVSDGYNRVGKITAQARNLRITWDEGVKALNDDKRTMLASWQAYEHSVMSLDERKLADETKALIQASDANFEQIVSSMQLEDDKTLANDQMTAFIDPIVANIEKLSLMQQHEAADLYRRASSDYDHARTFSIAVLLVALILGAVMAQAIIGGIVHPLATASKAMRHIAEGDLTQEIHGGGDNEIGTLLASTQAMHKQLLAMISEIDRGVQGVLDSSLRLTALSSEVKSSSAVQAEATTSMAAAAEQLTTSIEQSSGNAGDAELRAGNSRNVASKGALEMRMAVEELAQIADAVTQTAHQIEILGDKAQEIDSIVSTIKDVADQTNLLALNASIEAARAGEHGRGFAVVADEVRKLAERTTQSAEEITGMVRTIQTHTAEAIASMKAGRTRVSEGVARAGKMGDTMRDINDSSVDVMASMSEISSALAEQKASSQDIARNVERIAHMTEENNHAVAEVSAAAARLEVLAADLKQVVSRFKVRL